MVSTSDSLSSLAGPLVGAVEAEVPGNGGICRAGFAFCQGGGTPCVGKMCCLLFLLPRFSTLPCHLLRPPKHGGRLVLDRLRCLRFATQHSPLAFQWP